MPLILVIEDDPTQRLLTWAVLEKAGHHVLEAAERIRKVTGAQGVRDVYVISNNHFEGKGPANALMIRSMLEGRRVSAPPVLFETYREVLSPWAEPAER